jgi:hypothetical protein
LSLRRWHARILGIAAVEVSAHAAHGCSDDIARLEFVAGRFFDDADALDAKNTRKGDTGGVPLTSEELRAVEAEGFDADEDLTGLGMGQVSSLRASGLQAL